MSRKTIFVLAAIGFSLSFIVNLSTLAGINIADNFPFVWGLHVYIFVVFIPTIFILNKNPELRELKKSGNKNPFKMWGTAFKDTPKLVVFAFFMVFVYALLNFLVFMQLSEGGGPHISGDKYVLSNHGDIIREITEMEYNRFRNNELRGFSGLWMMFFALPTSLFWPKTPKL